jgi:hypothetical protein
MKQTIFLIMFIFTVTTASHASDTTLIKPFTLAQTHSKGKFAEVKTFVKKRLELAGYQLLGTYVPYPNAEIFIITNKSLTDIAANTTYGGFGAALRVSITKTAEDVQVAHNNPEYIALAYKMKDTLASESKNLANTLGFINNFGGEGVEKEKLANYQYDKDLEGFGGFYELASYSSYAEALQHVEKGFAINAKKIGQVYRLDIPGKKQTLFGVRLVNDAEQDKYLSDKYIMEIIDHKKLMRSAHLPYEIMVHNNQVISLHPHFRVAMNFPDIKMYGKHSFGRLLELPYVYKDNFTKIAMGEKI